MSKTTRVEMELDPVTEETVRELAKMYAGESLQEITATALRVAKVLYVKNRPSDEQLTAHGNKFVRQGSNENARTIARILWRRQFNLTTCIRQGLESHDTLHLTPEDAFARAAKYKPHIARTLRRLRLQAGISKIEDAALRLEITVHELSSYESRLDPRLPTTITLDRMFALYLKDPVLVGRAWAAIGVANGLDRQLHDAISKAVEAFLRKRGK